MHKSVLLEETINNLNIKKDGIYVDATLGYGGHSSEILQKIPKGWLYAFDQDAEAISYSQKRLESIASNFTIIYSNFVNLKDKLAELKIHKVDGIIFDLGLSSPQIDNENRGFSFMKDAPLDMRMDLGTKKTASDIINTYKEEDLRNIFYQYGEEKLSKAIAKRIVEERPIKRTLELVEVIKKAVGLNYFNKEHPERKIFQAIRIELNQELKVLESVLPDAINLLKPKGRICVITFHSLEDRIVKQTFKKYSETNPLYQGLPQIPVEYQPKINLINKKPILPSEAEININKRSKSAKLRVIEKRKIDD